MAGNFQRRTGFQIRKDNRFVLRIVMATAIMTLAILAILPFTQALSGDPRDAKRLVSVDAVIPPPEPPPPEPPPPPEEEREEPPPQLDTPPPMLDLSMLESMMNPSTGGVMAQGLDFSRIQGAASVQDALVFSLRDLDRRPTPTRGGNPTFPPEVQRMGFDGIVVRVRIRLDGEGYVQVLDIFDSPHELITQALRRQMPTWRYTPPTKDGEPVIAEYIQGFRIQFN
jgi:periplasmic protein TonB